MVSYPPTDHDPNQRQRASWLRQSFEGNDRIDASQTGSSAMPQFQEKQVA
jgi:hypothetical protein